MTVHNQKAEGASVETKRKLMKKSDYLRINLLFVKWRNWLYYLTFAYVAIFVVWRGISGRLSSFCFSMDDCSRRYDRDYGVFKLSWKTLPTLSLLVLGRGLVFCADGIVSSWLKSPFGQITYSINRSEIESSRSDEIITILTEINEHFKETFKKFGIFAISTDLVVILKNTVLRSYGIDRTRGSITRNSQKGVVEEVKDDNSGVDSNGKRKIVPSDSEIENIVLTSLIVPIIFAYWRIRSAEKMIRELEFEDD